MRDDRDPPLHPAPSALPTRPQLGTRPFAGGRSAPVPRPGTGPGGPATPPPSLRPFVPRPAARATEAGVEATAAPGAEVPRMSEGNPEPARPPAPMISSQRRTPRMLAALVQQEQVAIWPVDATLERPALPAAPNDSEAALTQPDEAAADVPGTQAQANGETQPAEWMSDTSPPSVERLLAEPSPRAPSEAMAPRSESASMEGGETVSAEPVGTETETVATEAARILEAIAERVRSGDIVVAPGRAARGTGNEAAVLAAVLASLLGGHDGP